MNQDDARKADNFSTVLRQTGKYTGVITRAQALTSKKGTQGLGLSFKSDDGATANYLDIYTAKANGEKLRGNNLVQAILCCLKLRTAKDGNITFDRWDKESGEMCRVTELGYPELMGRRIGLILQEEIQEHSITGEPVNRLNIVAIFEADTGFTSTEILDKKTKPERAEAIWQTISRNRVRDTRKRSDTRPSATQANPPNRGESDQGFDDDIPF